MIKSRINTNNVCIKRKYLGMKMARNSRIYAMPPTPKDIIADKIDKTLYTLYTPLTDKLSKMVVLLESIDKKLEKINNKMEHNNKFDIMD